MTRNDNFTDIRKAMKSTDPRQLKRVQNIAKRRADKIAETMDWPLLVQTLREDVKTIESRLGEGGS